jgi:hypothetical protein
MHDQVFFIAKEPNGRAHTIHVCQKHGDDHGYRAGGDVRLVADGGDAVNQLDGGIYEILNCFGKIRVAAEDKSGGHLHA